MKKDVALELGPEEEVVAIVRRGFTSQAHRWLLIGIWILLPFFFFFPLLSFGGMGLLVFVALATSGILYALREWRVWYHTMWVITDFRIIDIDQLSWAQKDVQDLPLRQIKKVHVQRHSVGAKLFRHATVWIESTSSHTHDIELEGVNRPKHLKQLLRELKQVKKTT